MKNSKKIFNGTGQSTIEVKKSQKHDANLQKNSTLYFQIGLILCLLGTYALFEMQFQDKKIIVDTSIPNDPTTIEVATVYRLEPEKKQEQKLKVNRSKTLIDKYEEVKDDLPQLEDDIFTPDAPDPSDTTDALIPGDLPEDDDPKDEDIFVPFVNIEVVPVYPGCEKYDTNEDRRKCMSKKISKLVNKKFNADIATDYGITGMQRIFTQFTVDKNGNVTDIKIRGPHPALEKEAKRVIDKIPHMKPGYQRDTPVGVIYTLPIKFQVRD